MVQKYIWDSIWRICWFWIMGVWMGFFTLQYNNFFCNILNGLVFGEQLSHSGNNYRNHTWWVPLIILSFNLAAIGFNILLIALFTR